MSVAGLPDITQLEERPILQLPASKDTWVRVTFYSRNPLPPTRAEIFRTMEMLETMYNFWKDAPTDDANQ